MAGYSKWNQSTGQYEWVDAPTPQSDYVDPDLLPNGTYRPPSNENGSPLGAPPGSQWNVNTGQWQSADRPATPGVDLPLVRAASTQPTPTPTPTPTPGPPSPPRPPGGGNTNGGGGPLPPVVQAGNFEQPQPFGQGKTVDYYGNQFDKLLAMLTERLTNPQQQQFFQPAPAQPDPQVVAMMKAQQAQQAAETERRAAFEEQVRQQVLGYLKQGQQPVDYQQIAEGPEGRAFSRVQERALERFRAQQAEQRAAQGTGQNQRGEVGGALGADIAGGQSSLAENIAGFQSRLIADQLQQRRQQLMQALQMGAGILSQDQQVSIQRELAQMDNALKMHLGQADIGLRGFLGGGQLSLGLLQALMGNQHFYDTLGYNIGRDTQDFNLRSMGAFL